MFKFKSTPKSLPMQRLLVAEVKLGNDILVGWVVGVTYTDKGEQRNVIRVTYHNGVTKDVIKPDSAVRRFYTVEVAA